MAEGVGVEPTQPFLVDALAVRCITVLPTFLESGDPTGCRSRSTALKGRDSSQRKLWGQWSGERDSNPRQSRWQRGILPLNYRRKMEEGDGIEPCTFRYA